MLGAEVVTMPLPYGQNWLWYPEFNIVALAPHLTGCERERALDELQAQWRQSIRLVRGPIGIVA